MAAVRRSCTGSRHSARAHASTPSRSSSRRVRATSLTAERMAGTPTPRKSRSLLRYLLACPARCASARGSSAATTRLAAASASKTALVTMREDCPMPRQNRVTPYGELIAVPDRGMFWGNRGPLLDREGRLARYSRGQAWAICVLSFKGRRRQQWTPGRLTALSTVDELAVLWWWGDVPDPGRPAFAGQWSGWRRSSCTGGC